MYTHTHICTHTLHTSNLPSSCSDLALHVQKQEQEKPAPGSYLNVTSHQESDGLPAPPPRLYLLFQETLSFLTASLWLPEGVHSVQEREPWREVTGQALPYTPAPQLSPNWVSLSLKVSEALQAPRPPATSTPSSPSENTPGLLEHSTGLSTHTEQGALTQRQETRTQRAGSTHTHRAGSRHRE